MANCEMRISLLNTYILRGKGEKGLKVHMLYRKINGHYIEFLRQKKR